MWYNLFRILLSMNLCQIWTQIEYNRGQTESLRKYRRVETRPMKVRAQTMASMTIGTMISQSLTRMVRKTSKMRKESLIILIRTSS